MNSQQCCSSLAWHPDSLPSKLSRSCHSFPGDPSPCLYITSSHYAGPDCMEVHFLHPPDWALKSTLALGLSPEPSARVTLYPPTGQGPQLSVGLSYGHRAVVT